MLTLDYIKENLIWAVKFYAGRTSGTRKEIERYLNDEDVRDVDVVCWEGQPAELQDFCKEWEESNVLFIDDFYNEYAKRHSDVNESIARETGDDRIFTIGDCYDDANWIPAKEEVMNMTSFQYQYLIDSVISDINYAMVENEDFPYENKELVEKLKNKKNIIESYGRKYED